MFHFDWVELVTDELIGRLAEAAAQDLGAEKDDVKNACASILSSCGGMPISQTALDATERTNRAALLIAEAVAHYLAVSGYGAPRVGYLTAPSQASGIDMELRSRTVVDVNRAGVAELDALPGIGTVRARAIVAERSANGWFESMEELAQRVDGVGDGAVELLRHVTSFTPPVGPTHSPIDPDNRLDSLLQIALSLTRYDSLATLLRDIAAVSAHEPHPATSNRVPRFWQAFPLPPLDHAEHIGVLAGRDYYQRLPDYFGEAHTSIEVAMFHVAMPSADHPTRLLLDELIAANGRGVNVRVLLDRDRDDDPYLSTVINQAAKDYLENAGISCKYDPPDVLMHSKFVIIDGKRVIIGSHNWSAGSYFHFDDLTFVVESATLAAKLTARFDALWA